MDDHPAKAAGARSRAAVESRDREAWLALWADDAIVEDPIGVSPIDPEGKGQRGIEAITRFWDDVIMGPARTTFDYHTQYSVGRECACVGSLTNHFENGSTFTVEGVFVYAVNEEGKLTSLRTYWEFDKGVFKKAPDVQSDGGA